MLSANSKPSQWRLFYVAITESNRSRKRISQTTSHRTPSSTTLTFIRLCARPAKSSPYLDSQLLRNTKSQKHRLREEIPNDRAQARIGTSLLTRAATKHDKHFSVSHEL